MTFAYLIIIILIYKICLKWFSHTISSIQIQTWWRITSREKCWYTPSSNSPTQFFPYCSTSDSNSLLVIFSTSNGLQVSNVCISVAWYVCPNPNNSCIGVSWYVGPYPNKLQISVNFFLQVKAHFMHSEGADVILHMIDHFHTWKGSLFSGVEFLRCKVSGLIEKFISISYPFTSAYSPISLFLQHNKIATHVLLCWPAMIVWVQDHWIVWNQILLIPYLFYFCPF